MVDLVSNEASLRARIKELNGGKPVDQKGNPVESKKAK
jgi:hypothetical protein